MSANSHARVLSGVAAGLTAMALLAATMTVPASAAPQPLPVPPSAKIKLPDGTAASRVIKDRYLVETVATPLSRGGNRFASKASTDAARTAANFAGAKIGSTYSELWSGVEVTATSEQVQVLAQSPSVKAIYPVLRVDLPKTTKSATTVSSAVSQISAVGVTQTGAGIRVGVIDSGVDYNNTDLGGAGVNDQKKDFGRTAPRVKYGYDFVGNDYNPDEGSSANPDAYPDDCNGHGTHVAGIVGASGNGDGPSATGVAPKVTFGAYRVFGCEGSTDTAIILKALNRAKRDGMNVVNISLGSDFDSWPSYPEAVAVANLSRAGVVVVVAAGNSGETGLFSAGTPAVGAGVISVASYEPAVIRTRAISVNGNKYPYTPVDGTATAPVADQLTLQNASPNTACSALTPAQGTALLIVRGGDCTYNEKVENAIAAGAAAAVIYNKAPGLDSFTARASETDSTDLPIPAISLGGTDGANLAASIGTGSPMTWMDVQSDLTNPDGGHISTFSSAGLAADLSLVPTISAPGAKIYSTLPIERGEHGNLSGTSMAAPSVAGAVALMLQAKSSLKGHPTDVAKQLYATAVPVAKSPEAGVTTRPEGVFRQGSGLINVAGALNAGVTASPSTLKLGEGTSHVVTVKLTNRTLGKLVYQTSRVSGVSASASTLGGSSVGTTTPLYGFGEVGFKAYSKSVTITAGKTARIKVRLTAPSSVLMGKAGLLYGGWVQFTTTGAGNTVSVPFAGMRGDYQAVKVLNNSRFDDGVTTRSLPSLGYADGEHVQFETGSNRNYTMSGDDVPYAIYHLDYPASDVQLRITNQRTRKSYDAILDLSTYNQKNLKISRKSTHLNRQPRDASAQAIPLIGFYSKGKAHQVYDGTWKMTLRVLKPLGTSSRSKHWEAWTSKVFTIG